MIRKSFTWLAVSSLVAALGLSLGCQPSADLTGASLPNSRPDTHITGEPPTIIESSFMVRFYWTGYDPDGRVAGYQWKISDNSTNGISVQDTLTFDPATGDTLNPWHFTTATDSTFVVTADIPDFPGDPTEPVGAARSYMPHTIFVRSVDERGGVDDTPAYMSFTATTLLPTVRVDTPTKFVDQLEVKLAPPSVTFGWTGLDSDFDLGIPTHVRYLWKPAYVPSIDAYISTRHDFNTHVETLVDFADSGWTEWLPYEPQAENRRITFPQQAEFDSQDRKIRYLFAIQARDTAGAVSIDRVYGSNVVNCQISSRIRPTLTVAETFLGTRQAQGTENSDTYDIASGQELNFSWSATAEEYAGRIVSYQYGWDVDDPTDPTDPSWAVSPGLSSQHLRAPPQTFPSGLHTFTVVVVDDSDQITRYPVNLFVVPVPDLVNQLPVLLVDDVNDHTSNAWMDENNIPRDNDIYRDAFWQATLQDVGGVANFDPGRDVIDTEDVTIEYRTVVDYRSIVWTAKRVSAGSAVSNQFRRDPDLGDRFIWLSPYQRTVGNLLYCSSRGMNNFIMDRNYMVPIIFDTRERTLDVGDITYTVGFPDDELPDGTEVETGPTRYPYLTNGVAVFDIFAPGTYPIYGRPSPGRNDRSASCNGLKGLALDENFRARYMTGPAPFATMILTDAVIDHRDASAVASGDLDDLDGTSFGWGADEFYDNTSVAGTRGTPWSPQICQDPATGAVEPCLDFMFRAEVRYNWLRDLHIAADNPDWPFNIPPPFDLEDWCGELGLDNFGLSARAQGVPVGFLTHKTKYAKPSQKGDIIWGFDPYRFDNIEVRRAIRWVLGEHFGLVMRN